MRFLLLRNTAAVASSFEDGAHSKYTVEQPVVVTMSVELVVVSALELATRALEETVNSLDLVLVSLASSVQVVVNSSVCGPGGLPKRTRTKIFVRVSASTTGDNKAQRNCINNCNTHDLRLNQIL